MSALIGIVQPAAAYLLTDGAGYYADGRVREIVEKVIPLPSLNMAVGWSGYASTREIEDAIEAYRPATQSDVLAALPKIMRREVARTPTEERGKAIDHPGLSILVASWSDGPLLWAIHSDAAVFGDDYEPFTARQLRGFLDTAQGLESIFGRPVAMTDPASFAPAVDGLALLEHQRREPFEGDDGRPTFMVGGFAQLTTVAATGIETRVLKHWPDRIGEKIDPDAPPRAPGGVLSRLTGKLRLPALRSA